MSTLLYALGDRIIRARKLVLTLWIAILALLGTGAALFGQGANAPITIPGTESQEAITSLARTFPEVSGTNATIIIVAPKNARADDPDITRIINDAAHTLTHATGITAVQTPFTTPASPLSDNGRAALIIAQIDGEVSSIPKATVTEIERVTSEIQDRLPPGAHTARGGEAFSAAMPTISPTEAVGVIIAFIVLILTLGSLIAAGMPLLIAILGVGVAIAGLFIVTAFVDLTSTTPMLALMLGLAVGIDYTLFIVSRHQEQMLAGLNVNESIKRATATSGSAVVFAGLTVIIALVGLSVAGIPFLTALGIAAAAAVAIAVLIAITLTPAILAMAKERILPRRRRNKTQLATHPPADTPQPLPRTERVFTGWVRAATRHPILTIISVLALVGTAAIPALDLRLALPNATSLPADDPARITYELTGEHFGEGFNGPLLLTGSIIDSTDPLTLMKDLADEIRKVPGVADVPLATPNQGADTGIIQVIPEHGPHAASTTELVHKLRSMHDTWETKYGVSLAVTGFTAVGIDVSELLLHALTPFSVLVVGLSLILLAMVFRSVWVPVKATLGYLLSVGAAFGAVVAVFQWGWFQQLLHVPSSGPVLSFMPIILMGVLFGLAMDYEVFLVSRIREEYVHGADAPTAITRGFSGSARVVTAAALIMFSVFAAFVPEGDPNIKVIALGLAVGVFVDAFLVRMTLVPAILALLGDRAWRMPRWLDRLLPVFDVEGEALAREVAFAHWPKETPDALIAADNLQLSQSRSSTQGAAPVAVHLRVMPTEALFLNAEDPLSVPLAEAFSGRRPPVSGTLKVLGLLLPERACSLRKRTAWADASSLRDTLRDQPALIVVDLRNADASALASDLRSALTAQSTSSARGSNHNNPTVLVIIGDATTAASILPAGLSLRTPSFSAPSTAHHVDTSLPRSSSEMIQTTLEGV